jgi:hypothetical protein
MQKLVILTMKSFVFFCVHLLYCKFVYLFICLGLGRIRQLCVSRIHIRFILEQIRNAGYTAFTL